MGFRGPRAPATGRLQKSLGLLCQAACPLHHITLQWSWNSGLREPQIPGLSTQLWPLAANSFSSGTQTCGLSQREE